MNFKKLKFSLKCALRGLKLHCRENSFQLMIIISVLVLILGLILKLSYYEWLIIFLCFAFNLSLESINTVWEATFDYLEPKYSLSVKNIKDLIAASVLIVSFFSLIIGIIIFVPKIIQFFQN
ncbi:MAG: diacylglycerol kinase family protein [Minisyncoccia bacterium]